MGRTFLWAGALFYPIPICLGMLGLVGIGYGLTAADVGGDIVAVGPYIVSHIGLPMVLIIAYVLVILAACYSTIDGASSAPVVDRRRRPRQALRAGDDGIGGSSTSPSCRC